MAVEVVSTKTTADVMWKDGRVEKGIRSNDLIPIQHLDSHEFCPGDFVVDKRREQHQPHPTVFNRLSPKSSHHLLYSSLSLVSVPVDCDGIFFI